MAKKNSPATCDHFYAIPVGFFPEGPCAEKPTDDGSAYLVFKCSECGSFISKQGYRTTQCNDVIDD